MDIITYTMAVADANAYTDSQLNNGIFVGYVTNGGSLPTARPNGDPLQNEDYCRPATTSTFPFTIGTVTFENKLARAYYFNSAWIVDTGAIQDTSETPLKSPALESISGTAVFQSDVNKEVLKAAKQLEYPFDTASTGWLISHNLGRYPHVICLDDSGETIYGSITYNNSNSLTIHFANAQSGKALLN